MKLASYSLWIVALALGVSTLVVANDEMDLQIQCETELLRVKARDDDKDWNGEAEQSWIASCIRTRQRVAAAEASYQQNRARADRWQSAQPKATAVMRRPQTVPAASSDTGGQTAVAPALPPLAPGEITVGENGEPPWLYELPFSLRRDLPPLAVNMSYFNSDDPTARYVRVDMGDAAGEQQMLVSNVMVKQIRARDIVFEYRGQAFRVPR